MVFTATYSPEDNKLRLSASSRLDPELYARVRAAGFIWAPQQKIFVAPKWTPDREDLCIELAGEIGDEDTSLVERSEHRAERFEDYSESRAKDAEQAHKAVSAIADGIPLGQPILIGHHSERHARKDAEKIENGMRRAVKMWETSQYWKQRAAGAIRAAKYKELPAVRARRIKTIEADIRSMIADYTRRPNVSAILQTPWDWKPSSTDLTVEQIEAERALAKVPHVWCGPAGRGGRWVKHSSLEAIKRGNARSIAHREMRLEYERAMLGESGGLAADRFNIEIGGRVFTGRDWYVVTKLNKKDDALLSVSVIGRYCTVIPIEEIRDYQAPAAGDAEKVKAVKKLPPLVNFRAAGCIEMTMAQWKDKTRWSDSNFAANFDANGNATFGRVSQGETAVLYRQRSVCGRGQVWTRVPVFLTDAKIVEPPKSVAPSEPVSFSRPDVPTVERPVYQAPEPTKFDALKETLKSGVKVVSAPQLFPTPKELARRMVELADIQPGETVLEPSAGTGSIVREIIETVDTEIVGYEINQALVSTLNTTFPSYRLQTRCKDFLEVTEGQGQFPVILMNPPFGNAQDVAHIKHAITFLKPGGRLVAICANGPRQNDALRPLASSWEPLPTDTFKESGTGVNTVLLTIEA
jgi:phospholipid N-methyltransferase